MGQGSSEIGQAMDPAERTSATPTSAPTSDDIRSDIEQTRGEMSGTIDAIQARLSPRRLVSDAQEQVKEATSSTIADLLEAARQNPIPVAVASVTMTAVLLRAFTKPRNRTRARAMTGTTSIPARSRVQSNGTGRHTGRFLAGVCTGLVCTFVCTRRQ